MIYTELTKMAMKLCFDKHKDQVDKCGIPYPFHPFHVAETMPDEETTCVALLHDIIEDTDVTVAQLDAMGFPKTVTEAIALMTHDKGTPYFEYIEGIKKNEIAREVKLSDLAHNSDMSRLDSVTDKDLQRVKKYMTAITMLND